MDIFINNVVCSFSVRCHLNLKEIALTGSNVEYRLVVKFDILCSCRYTRDEDPDPV